MKEHNKEELIIKRIIYIILVIAFLCGSIYVGRYFYERYKTKELEDLLNIIAIDNSKVTKEKTEMMLKLEELQKVNSEIIAWLQIDGTNINYPVLQGKDNSYYMTHTYNKEYSKNGSLFLDKDYNWNLPSTNLLIYGHNNKNGTMFEELMKYKEAKFYEEHSTIKFTTNSEDAQYEIIAVFLSRVYYKSENNVFRYYYFINAENEAQFDDYILNSKKASIYDTGKTAEYGDQLLTLSTCSYHTEDGRLAVVAKKVK